MDHRLIEGERLRVLVTRQPGEPNATHGELVEAAEKRRETQAFGARWLVVEYGPSPGVETTFFDLVYSGPVDVARP